ncbi:hypothetical protein EDF31_1187 [Curtobacterium sp. PhB142]|nr:hypothetical protein EDF31_1187 [Curtobacterium sp. PhB142]TCL98414.1 hypothetical protein EDF26_1197 [Curtobacterium sp. PhB134]TCU42685.1 hypothetical protein EDF33_1127 [Curtobacterium sp. PhB146]TDW38468.1 hypothetical protein EDF52_12420 [Curtobacterium sp. PhB42]TDW48475.1 hypothetical protein EDF47_12120 [Curtobacterium sp. PhB190]TDW63488.1 hypothetical protein EDF51_1208 [Curtobacterium sp. PhB25]
MSTCRYSSRNDTTAANMRSHRTTSTSTLTLTIVPTHERKRRWHMLQPALGRRSPSSSPHSGRLIFGLLVLTVGAVAAVGLLRAPILRTD